MIAFILGIYFGLSTAFTVTFYADDREHAKHGSNMRFYAVLMFFLGTAMMICLLLQALFEWINKKVNDADRRAP